MSKKEQEVRWIEKTVKAKIRKGPKGDWWFMMIGNKKFVFREVQKFFDEKDEPSRKEPF